MGAKVNLKGLRTVVVQQREATGMNPVFKERGSI